ncbi:MAG TPA: glycosyltransferase family 39 protein [Thermodesulfobacteriota bacterium]|nr:glycosyltransferase family 39 protein [Deltaproteobacteria bacterium]HNR11840.1 glycosyltransferase family 39 protein [Thermodesulfobacteriota bacterium]HNU70105.1 glycosyltransferase family 39 protein [Thermodesulfobacteriota bacterium]HQO77009.1 glycosyltransferase family 39 protein [Thermodesulfobacteriota bacterium]
MHADGFHDSTAKKNTALIIVLLIVLALVLRVIALERLYVIARDGIRFLDLAEQYRAGALKEALAHPYHPLYPMLIALAGSVIGNLEAAGKTVGLVLSSLTVIPLFFLGMRTVGFRAAIVTTLFYVFQPYSVRFSVDVISDATFLFFFISSLALGMEPTGPGKSHFWGTAAAGLCAACAYLTRPEGILAIGFLLIWYGLFVSMQYRYLRKAVVQSVILLATFVILAFPYAAFIKAHTGIWQLSMKPSVSKSLHVLSVFDDQEQSTGFYHATQPGFGEGALLAPVKPNPWIDNPTIMQSVSAPVLKLIETYPYVLFLFFIVGCRVCWRQKLRYPGSALAMLTAMHLIVLCYVFYSIGYVSRRHFVPLIAMSLPIAGLGFWELHRLVAQWAARMSSNGSETIIKRAGIIMAALTVLILAPKALKSQGADKIPIKEAGMWIKSHHRLESSKPIIMAHEPLIAYYAEGTFIPVLPLAYPEFVAFVRREGIDFVVFDNDELEKGREFTGSMEADQFRPIRANFEGVTVYEVVH